MDNDMKNVISQTDLFETILKVSEQTKERVERENEIKGNKLLYLQRTAYFPKPRFDVDEGEYENDVLGNALHKLHYKKLCDKLFGVLDDEFEIYKVKRKCLSTDEKVQLLNTATGKWDVYLMGVITDNHKIYKVTYTCSIKAKNLKILEDFEKSIGFKCYESIATEF